MTGTTATACLWLGTLSEQVLFDSSNMTPVVTSVAGANAMGEQCTTLAGAASSRASATHVILIQAQHCEVALATGSPTLSLLTGALEELSNNSLINHHGHCAEHHRMQHSTCGYQKRSGGHRAMEWPGYNW